jgi:predicted phosphodiesterase
VCGLHGVEQILHYGDINDLSIVELFEAVEPFEVVVGNNYGDTMREITSRAAFPIRRPALYRTDHLNSQKVS